MLADSAPANARLQAGELREVRGGHVHEHTQRGHELPRLDAHVGPSDAEQHSPHRREMAGLPDIESRRE